MAPPRRIGHAALVCLLLVIGGWLVSTAGWIHAKAWLAQRLLASAWQETMANGNAAKPWAWADTHPLARLRVPAHGIDQIVLAGSSGSSLAFAPGHVDGSPAPGEPGLSLIGGHRDTHFAFLENVVSGDSLTIETSDGRIQPFRVTDSRIVDSRETRLDPTGESPALALVTCYPFNAVMPGGPLRYVVFAEASE
jgi:sortase A